MGIGQCHAQAAGGVRHQVQMNMIGHPAPRPHGHASPATALRKLVAIGGVVAIGEESLLPTIAALGHMVCNAGNGHACEPSHARSMS